MVLANGLEGFCKSKVTTALGDEWTDLAVVEPGSAGWLEGCQFFCQKKTTAMIIIQAERSFAKNLILLRLLSSANLSRGTGSFDPAPLANLKAN
jgi:hypothetical protein